MNIVCITDNGHGWGIVSAEQLKQARIAPADFSDFSYQTPNGEIYALEEDVDFPKYLSKLIAWALNMKSMTGISLMKIIGIIPEHGLG